MLDWTPGNEKSAQASFCICAFLSVYFQAGKRSHYHGYFYSLRGPKHIQYWWRTERLLCADNTKLSTTYESANQAQPSALVQLAQ